MDLDEVLVDFIRPFITFYNRRYGTKLTREIFLSFNLSQIIGHKRELVDVRVDEFYNSEVFQTLNPVEGAKEVLEFLSEKYELFIITSRPAHIKEKTAKWLERHFEKVFKHIHFSANEYIGVTGKTKAEICKNLRIDLLIEDNLGYAMEAAKSGIKVLMFDTPWNQTDSLHPNITRVSSWKEVLEELKV